MKGRTAAASAATMLGLVLGGATSSTAQAQQPGGEVAECVRGEWESTGVTFQHPGMDDFEFSGGDGAVLRVEEDGAVTADFTGMDQVTFSGESHDTTVRGHVELRGEGTGTITTSEDDGDSGTLEASNLDVRDVELTVMLTEPFDSRPIDRVPLNELRQLMEKHDDHSVRSETRYECGTDTLTVTKRAEAKKHHEGRADGGYTELVWTFEQVEE